jgi:uncharacterized protein YegL
LHADQSPILAVEEGRVLTEADTGGIPVAAAKSEKITVPLGRNRPHPEWVADLSPIPTVRSPALPEQKEMMLAKETTDLYASSPARLSPLRNAKTGQRLLEDQWSARPPPPMDSLEPLMRVLEGREPLLAEERDVSMLLVVDTSGSVKGAPLDGIKRSAAAFVELLRDTDQCAVITFNDQARLVTPFTHDRSWLKEEIAGLQPEGMKTVLFDALDQAFDLLKREKDRMRFVLLFSDGKDEGSRSVPEDVIRRARELRVSVFCVGYSRVEKDYLKTLEEISQQTGGIFAEAPRFEEIAELFKTARERMGKGDAPAANQKRRPI